ncbi:PREDICTED: ankyrin repeat and LEM domain-containing protein 1 [Gavialis gangeticus]|uniref:ankyrin repeat and LEM domain-containing protein 1 n=1 Tax=Gavialis gangeticus TaxID=94835 RepID=UPI00092E7152|nr:PREDICTED: ankyrin repeat and LEM domain-containing protein 1 [Gavialis gangeticus]
MTELAAQLCEALRGEEEAATVEALLKQGADPNLVLPEGIAAVHLAAGKERESGVRCLQLVLQYGGDPNARSAEELTPLHVAASWGCYKCLKLLLRKGGDPDLEDQDGSRAIDLAMEQGNTMCVQILQDFQRAQAWPVCLRRPQFSPDGPGRAGSPPQPLTADSTDCSVFSQLSEASSAPPSSTQKWLPNGSPREMGLDVAFPDTTGRPRSQVEPPPTWFCFSTRPDMGARGQPAWPQPLLCSTLLSTSSGPRGGAWSLPAAPEEEPAEAEDSLAQLGTLQPWHCPHGMQRLGPRAALHAGEALWDETVVVHSPRQPGNTHQTPGSASPCGSHSLLPSCSSRDTREPCPVPHSLAQLDGFLDPATGDWEGLDATSPDHAYLFCWAHSTALHDLDKTVMVPASLEKAPEISSGPLKSSSSQYSSCDSECYISTVEASDPAEAGRDGPASKDAWGTGRSVWQCPGKQLVLGPQGQSLKTPALGRAFVQDVPPSWLQLAEVAGGSAGDVCQGAHCFGQSGGLRPAGKPALVLHAGSTENSPSPCCVGSQSPTQTPQHIEPVEHGPRQGSNRATSLSLPRASCCLAPADLGTEDSGPGKAHPSGDCRLGMVESATLGQLEGRQLCTHHSPAARASPRCGQGRREGQSQAWGLSARGSDLGMVDTVPLSRATAGTADTVPLSRATASTADTVPLSRATADTVLLSRATAGTADTVLLSRATADTVPLSRATAGTADTVLLSRATVDTVPLSRATAGTADMVLLSRATADTVPLSRSTAGTADTVLLSRATADTVPLSRATAGTADTVPLSRATAGTADTVPLSRAGESIDGEESEATALLLQHLGSPDSAPKGTSFANSTRTPRSSSLPPCPAHCHITPRTKSRLNASTARGNSSSSSSSLFDKTLELPQRPQRVRRPPETSRMPVSQAGGLLESTRASHWEAAGSGSLDETVVLLPATSLPAASGQSTAPSTSPTALQSPAGVTCLHAPETTGLRPPRMEHPSTAGPASSSPGPGESSWLTEEDCTECPGLGAPVRPPATMTSTQDWFGSELGSGEPSQSLAQGLGGLQPGGKKPLSRSRVSFSRLSAARPALTPPGSGRLSPVPDMGDPGIPLSPGGRPVSQGAGEAVEYLYLDEEKGHALIERHVPPTDNTSCADTSSEDTIIYDWRACASQRGAKENRLAPTCSDEALLQKLRKLGADPGPVTDSTRNLYVQQLDRLQSSPRARAGRGATGHSPELSAALETLQIPDCQADEVALAAQFDQPDKARKWREGVLKSSFNYLLLDPRVTQNLPLRCHVLSPAECFQTFVRAIFYVGKGKRARPYCHLYEALAHYRGGKKQACAKVRHILDIWAGGQGVVSVHCFQNVIPVEAYTREACMVDALGLAMLTNQKRGNCYGVAAGWLPRRRRRLGVHLLHRALQIFLAEGERQLRPADIQVGQ